MTNKKQRATKPNRANKKANHLDKERGQPTATDKPELPTMWSPLLRVVGRDLTALELLQKWQPAGAVPPSSSGDVQQPSDSLLQVMVRANRAESVNIVDYVQIDPMLTVNPSPILSEEPVPGAGYAGFTPTQRYHFLQWLADVTLSAPAAFRHLYIAHLEVGLFDTIDHQHASHQELLRLAETKAWLEERLLWRALLLSYQIRNDGAELSHWLAVAPLPTPLLGLAMGQLLLAGQPLKVEHLPALLHQWQIPGELPAAAILDLRLAYLQTTLGAEPLAHLHASLVPETLVPQPWRCAHQDLRVATIQLDLRQQLLPILRELSMQTSEVDAPLSINRTNATVEPSQASQPDKEEEQAATENTKPWRLIVEFGESRSDFFVLVVEHAKRSPSYLRIMDENRKMIHRVTYAKSDMRRFWYLWEYIQSWSSTQVYLNSKELRKEEIYPYSPSLR